MKNKIKSHTSDAAASEAIGFLLIFTIIIAGIGLVTLYGYPMLMKQQTGADEQIMEKNMIVLQNDFKSITYKTVPYKETSLKIGGGTLWANDFKVSGPTFRILNGGADVIPVNPTGDLRYITTSSNTEISLQNGAVVKKEVTNTGSFMLAEPRWFYDDMTQTLVINLINISTSGPMSHQGIGTVRMKLGQTEYIRMENTPAKTITIIYNKGASGRDFSTAWQNYFENSLKTQPCTMSGSTLTCTKPGVLVLVIKKTEVIISSV